MFDVIIDTREQKPWDLINAVNGSAIEGTSSAKLNTGDYSIVGMEDVVCIERKRGVVEIAGNVVQKRFQKEIERMSEFQYPFIIIEECTYSDIFNYPRTTNLPPRIKKDIKTKGLFILKKLNEYRIRYGIHVVLCENREMAEMTVISIMKEVWRNYH